MKFTLFFIPLVLVTISGLPLSFKNTINAATSANADPEAINSLKEYVKQLIADGEREEGDFTKIRDDAQAVLDRETDDLANAEGALKFAEDVHGAATAKTSAANAVELEKRGIREVKLGIKKEKKTVLDGAVEFEKNEQARLDRERALFNKVKGLLVGVATEGRRLLNADAVNQALALLETTDNADPDQVNDALALLDGLIDAGEVERQNVVDAVNKAQAEFNTASGIHAEAVAVHTLAEGALEDAQLELNDAKAVLTLRNTERATATADKQAADDDFKTKQQKLDTQSDRIASEKLDLEMIDNLLGKLD